MYICYIDEAGDTGRFNSAVKDAQPAFVLLGLFLPQSTLRQYTQSFVDLKRKYFPEKTARHHDGITSELKGADLRQVYTKNNERVKRHHTGFFQELLKLIETHNGKIAGRIYIKSPEQQQYSPSGIYTYSIQDTCKTFQAFLESKASLGAVICDSRDGQNHVSSHSIFTQMYKNTGDSYPNLIDMPTFGDSRNHAGIQTVDILCSALLYPMAVHAYCTGHGLRNTHVQPKYVDIRSLFRTRLNQMQYRYTDTRRRTGGIVVSDSLGHQNGKRLFDDPVNDGKPTQNQLDKLVQKFAPNS